MLYRFGASTPLAQLRDVGVFASWLFCALVIVGLTVVVSLNRRIGWNDAALGALVAAFPNSGFMGVPLRVALLGAPSAGPVILTMVIDLAERFGADNGRIARIILVSTEAAFVTFSLAVSLRV